MNRFQRLGCDGILAIDCADGAGLPGGHLHPASLLVDIPPLIIGWFMVRDRVNEIARVRDGYTGSVPGIAAPW